MEYRIQPHGGYGCVNGCGTGTDTAGEGSAVGGTVLQPMTKVALFGATGNVGKQLVAALKEQIQDVKDDASYHFLLFTRDISSTAASVDGRFEPVALPRMPKESNDEGNATEIGVAALAAALEGVETCFLCVPQMAVPKCKEYVEKLLPALTQAGVKRVVKVGTGNASEYEYGRRHQAAEAAIRNANLKLTVVEGGDFSTNPHWLGPCPQGAPYVLVDVFKGLSYLGGTKFRTMGNVFGFDRDGVKEPFMDLRDFGHALASCLLDAEMHEGQTYQVYSEAVAMADVARVYGELLHRNISVVDVSDDEARRMYAMEKMDPEFIDLLIDMSDEFRKGVFEPDDSWDGLEKLCPNRKPRTFRSFAEEKVNGRWKPIRLW